MRAGMLVASLVVLASCGEPARLSDAQLHVSFPEARSDGTLAFEPGGGFDVQLVAEVPDLVGSMRARAYLVPTVRPQGALAETVVSLRGEPGGGRAVGSGRLSWPSGGGVMVRAELGDLVDEQLASLDEARMAIEAGSVVREGSFLGVPLCVETSATSGQIELKVKEGRFASTGDTVKLPLREARCPGRPLGGEGHFNSVTATVSLGAQRVEVDATLEGSALSAHLVQDVAALQSLVLDVEASPSTLPAPGTVIEITVTARDGSGRVASVPVSLELAPAAQVLPAQATTDADGAAHFSVIAPEDVPQLRVDAVSGSMRHGITLVR